MHHTFSQLNILILTSDKQTSVSYAIVTVDDVLINTTITARDVPSLFTSGIKWQYIPIDATITVLKETGILVELGDSLSIQLLMQTVHVNYVMLDANIVPNSLIFAISVKIITISSMTKLNVKLLSLLPLAKYARILEQVEVK